jgi:isopentenyldiphosphate isomerase
MAQDPGELFDLYSADGASLGRTKPRALVHRDGDWHRSVHVWVLVEAAAPTLLFQRRSREKDTWPGAIDVAVTGHLCAGESVLDGLREAREEIGIELGPADVLRLGLRRRADEHAPGILDRELQEVFLARVALPLSALRPDPAEVDELIALPLDVAGALFRGEVRAATGMAFAGAKGALPVTGIELGDFVLPDDGYYARAQRSIEAILVGRPERAWELR